MEAQSVWMQQLSEMRASGTMPEPSMWERYKKWLRQWWKKRGKCTKDRPLPDFYFEMMIYISLMSGFLVGLYYLYQIDCKEGEIMCEPKRKYISMEIECKN